MRRLGKNVPGAPGVPMRLAGIPTRSLRGITRLIKNNPSDGLTQPEADRLWIVGVQASLLTACAGADNDIVYTAKAVGKGGNSIRVAYVVAGANTPLTVVVAGNDITVNVATSAGSAATSTAAQVKAAVDGSAPAAALVSTAIAPSNTGTGVVAAFALTNLTGGVDRTNIEGAMGDGRQSAGVLIKGRTAASNAGVRVVSPPRSGLRRR